MTVHRAIGVVATTALLCAGCSDKSSKPRADKAGEAKGATTAVVDLESWRAKLVEKGYKVGEKALPAAAGTCKGEHVMFDLGAGVTGTAGFLECTEVAEVRKELARYRRLGATRADGKMLTWVGVGKPGAVDVERSMALFAELIGRPGVRPPASQPVAIRPVARATGASVDQLAEQIRGTTDLGKLRALMRTLAGRGAGARATLDRLTQTLPPGSAVIAAAFAAQTSVFSPERGRRLALAARDPRVAAVAARNLAVIGGAQNRKTIEKLRAKWNKDATTRTQLTQLLAAVPKKARLGPSQLAVLEQLYASRDPAQLSAAQAKLLAADHPAMRWGVDRLLSLPSEPAHHNRLLLVRKAFYERALSKPR